MNYFKDLSLILFDNKKYKNLLNLDLNQSKEKYLKTIKKININLYNDFEFLNNYSDIIDEEEYILLSNIFISDLKNINNQDKFKLDFYFSSVLNFKKYFFLYPEFYFTLNNYYYLFKNESLINKLYVNNMSDDYIYQTININEYSEAFLIKKEFINIIIEEIYNIEIVNKEDSNNKNLFNEIISEINKNNLGLLLIKKF